MCRLIDLPRHQLAYLTQENLALCWDNDPMITIVALTARPTRPGCIPQTFPETTKLNGPNARHKETINPTISPMKTGSFFKKDMCTLSIKAGTN